MSVQEILYYDENGDEMVCDPATMACIDLTTCADMGSETWHYLRTSVASRLKAAGIEYGSLIFEDDRGN